MVLSLKTLMVSCAKFEFEGKNELLLKITDVILKKNKKPLSAKFVTEILWWLGANLAFDR